MEQEASRLSWTAGIVRNAAKYFISAMDEAGVHGGYDGIETRIAI